MNHETFMIGIFPNHLVEWLLQSNGGGPSKSSTWNLRKKEVVKRRDFPVTNALMPSS